MSIGGTISFLRSRTNDPFLRHRTGPPGCLQWNAPNYLHEMIQRVHVHAIVEANTTDIGTLIKHEQIMDLCNFAFEGEEKKDKWIQHPRHHKGVDAGWVMRVLVELLPDYYS